MRGLEVPARTDDFTADPVELFFDLSYVFAFAQLVYLMVHEPTWTGLGKALLLFTLMWLGWSQFHWSANAVSGNSRRVRIWFLVATAAAIPMGASIATAFDAGGFVFAGSQVLILGMGLAVMFAGLERDDPVAASLRAYARPSEVAIAVVVIGAFLNGNLRIWAWIVAVLIVRFGGMAQAGGREWIVRPGHFAERHGLIVIIALGEIIVATGLGVANTLSGGEGEAVNPSATTFLTLVAAAAFAGLFWWSYFDRPMPAWEHGAEQLDVIERGRFARDVWTLAHLPIVFGVIVSAAAVEEVALHPDEPLDLAFRLMLATGVTLFFGGILAGVYRAFKVIGWERIGTIAAVFIAVLVAAPVSGLVLLALVDVILAASLLFEHYRVETRAHEHTDAVNAEA